MLALVVIGLRWMTRHEPLDRDISAYAVIGREMLTGRVLYADLWDHKPPAIHMAFAAATAVAGPGVPAVLLVNLVFSLAAMAGLMVAGRQIGGSAGAVAAGVLWLLSGSDLGLQANQPNVELPMNACIAWALAMALGGRSQGTARGWMLPGAVVGIALLLKPVAAAPLGLLVAVDSVEAWRRQGLKTAATAAGMWLCGFALVVAPILVWFAIRAGFEPMWDALIQFNLAYGHGSFIANIINLGKIGRHLPPASLTILGLMAVAGGVGLFRITPSNRYRILAVLLGSAIAVASTGRFYPHYFQLLLPPLILAAAAGFGWASTWVAPLRIAAAGVLLVMAVVELGNTRLSPEEWSRRKYGEVFIDEQRVAEDLRTRLAPSDIFWQHAAQPGLYLLTETVPASGVVYDNPLLSSSPIHEELARRVIADLTNNPPKLIVVRKNMRHPKVLRWIRANYRLTRDPLPVTRYQLWEPRRAITIEFIEGSTAPGGPLRGDR